MAVKLNGLDLNGAALGTAQKTSKSQQANATDTQATADVSQQSQSSVSVSSTASMLANLQQSLAAQPAMDQNKIASISKALENGTYKIDPDKIAGGLLQSERTLDPLPRQEI